MISPQGPKKIREAKPPSTSPTRKPSRHAGLDFRVAPRSAITGGGRKIAKTTHHDTYSSRKPNTSVTIRGMPNVATPTRNPARVPSGVRTTSRGPQRDRLLSCGAAGDSGFGLSTFRSFGLDLRSFDLDVRQLAS